MHARKVSTARQVPAACGPLWKRSCRSMSNCLRSRGGRGRDRPEVADGGERSVAHYSDARVRMDRAHRLARGAHGNADCLAALGSTVPLRVLIRRVWRPSFLCRKCRSRPVRWRASARLGGIASAPSRPSTKASLRRVPRGTDRGICSCLDLGQIRRVP